MRNRAIFASLLLCTTAGQAAAPPPANQCEHAKAGDSMTSQPLPARDGPAQL